MFKAFFISLFDKVFYFWARFISDERVARGYQQATILFGYDYMCYHGCWWYLDFGPSIRNLVRWEHVYGKRGYQPIPIDIIAREWRRPEFLLRIGRRLPVAEYPVFYAEAYTRWNPVIVAVDEKVDDVSGNVFSFDASRRPRKRTPKF